MNDIYLFEDAPKSFCILLGGGQVDIQHLLADKTPLEMIPTAFWTLPSCAVVEYFKSGLSLTRCGLTPAQLLAPIWFFVCCGKPHCARPLQRLCGCFPFGFVVAARVGGSVEADLKSRELGRLAHGALLLEEATGGEGGTWLRMSQNLGAQVSHTQNLGR